MLNIKKEIKSIKAMFEIFETRLPEAWAKEDWYKEAKQSFKLIIKKNNESRNKHTRR